MGEWMELLHIVSTEKYRVNIHLFIRHMVRYMLLQFNI